MPLDTLLAALEREARGTADRLLSDARGEAEQIVAAADESLARRRDVSVTARVQELRAAMEQSLGAATRQARGEVLHARERLLARVFGAVRAALPGVLGRPEYGTLLASQVGAALTCLDSGEAATVRCSPALAVTIREAVAPHPGVAVETDDSVGSGFVLAAISGAVEVDATLESRLAVLTPALSREALRQLATAE